MSEQKFATRLNSFRAGGASAREAVRAVAEVPGISAVELNFPQHFDDQTPSIIDLAEEVGLAVTALNLRWDGAAFHMGAFTHPDAANRRMAIDRAVAAVDTAAAHGIGHVILWMGPDGHDHPFQADYRRLWAWEIEGFHATASRNPDIRVSVEYKPSEPRNMALIRTMGDSLIAVRDVGLTNFGVTLDFCHMLMSGESPAAAAAMALKDDKLFGVHINDGYGPADDGLMVGTVHFWQMLELFLVLRQGGFDNTIYFDTFPERVDPAAEAAANVASVKRLLAILDRVPADQLTAAQAAQDAAAATRIVQEAAFG